MKNATIRRALTRGLVSAALFVAQTSAFPQVRPAAPEPDQVAQFCAPPPHDADAPRFYCRSSDG
jgi:hypothetical protein